MNKSPIILILMLAVVLSMGCAKPDWTQDILVTVDVTGSWRSTQGGLMELKLEQQGSGVKGSMQLVGLPGVSHLAGPIDGTVSGDAFSFSGPSVLGKMTVNGDEMIGEVQGVGQAAFGGRVSYVLQRVDSAAPPRSQ